MPQKVAGSGCRLEGEGERENVDTCLGGDGVRVNGLLDLIDFLL